MQIYIFIIAVKEMQSMQRFRLLSKYYNEHVLYSGYLIFLRILRIAASKFPINA